ncbi:uncharacterized protein LOC126680101 [Mercurialis annua]|uniref:uncharacterized protein LOC126680101 n=1 Tax=Mercurialis annua TaxID=3986 RepID=UPI00215EC831|nr:uncharacterized protein LOC126680101 [Mercurialis annua]
MALLNSLLTSNLFHHSTGGADFPVFKRPLIQVVRLKEKKPNAPKAINVSRRDALLYLSAGSLAGFTIFTAEPAEARIGRQEMKKKVLEKLREKARMSKTENGKTESPSSQSSSKQESVLPLLPPLPFPNLQAATI